MVSDSLNLGQDWPEVQQLPDFDKLCFTAMEGTGVRLLVGKAPLLGISLLEALLQVGPSRRLPLRAINAGPCVLLTSSSPLPAADTCIVAQVGPSQRLPAAQALQHTWFLSWPLPARPAFVLPPRRSPPTLRRHTYHPPCLSLPGDREGGW